MAALSALGMTGGRGSRQSCRFGVGALTSLQWGGEGQTSFALVFTQATSDTPSTLADGIVLLA